VSEPTHGSVRGDAPGGLAWATDEPALEAPRPRTRAEIRAARRAAAPQHRHPWIRRGLFGVSSLVVVSLVLGLAAYVKLNGNINRVDITAALGDRPSQAATTDPKTKLGPLNIMVMGSDIRGDGKNTKDKVADGVMQQWNANFTLGGPACVIRTFEGLTGVYIDHFVVIDFRGFQSMVDALGGVTVCTPEAIHDDKAHLDLPAGRTKVNGKQALGYVRVRKSVGDGSDLELDLVADAELAGRAGHLPSRTEPAVGPSSRSSWPSDERSCHGTLATMTPGVKSSRPLSRRALWLCSRCSYHFPRTYSGM